MPNVPERDSAVRLQPAADATDSAGVVLTVRLGITVLRLGAPLESEQFVAALAAADMPLPTVACRSASWDEGTVFWVSPGEWWLVGHNDTLAEPMLRSGLPVPPRALVDLSHGRTVIRIGGAHAGDVIGKGCPLDLDTDVFPVGGCPQSVLAGINLLLHRLPASRGFDLYTPRSYARHLWEWLLLAGAEYRVAVTN